MIAVGAPLPERRLTVDPAALAALAVVLRDPNPIHLDPAAVAAAGLGDRLVNQGPANLAYIVDMLADVFPGHRLAALDSRYLANVHAGDTVEAGGIVTRVEGAVICCDAWLKVMGSARPAVTATVMLASRD